MTGYYKEKLAADKLRRVYEIAPPRIRQYLEAEISFVLDHINPADVVLELGCGYGRVLGRLADKATLAIGIDTSKHSLRLVDRRRMPVVLSNAASLGLCDNSFDTVACIQNGISAFHVDQRRLIKEAIRITHPGGTILFSSYSEKFWNDRLGWFEIQAQHGLLGEIDYDATGNGVIVCKDGFTASTVTPDQFRDLVSDLGVNPVIEEVDGSSLFCIITLP